jgi:hypothetical protein
MEAKVVPEKWREAQEEVPTSGGRDTITTQKHLLLKPAFQADSLLTIEDELEARTALFCENEYLASRPRQWSDYWFRS